MDIHEKQQGKKLQYLAILTQFVQNTTIIILFGLFHFEKMCCTMCLIIFIFEVDKILVKVHNFKCMSV